MAPVDGGAKGLLPWQRCPAAPGEQPETVVQAFQDLVRSHQPRPGRCQFDGQRHAIQPVAHLSHGRGVLVRERERRLCHERPVDEQPDRLVPLDSVWSGHPVGIGGGERWDEPRGLAGDVQGLPAGRQDAKPRRSTQQGLRQVGHVVDDVFAVVEHEQELLVLKVIRERLLQRPRRLFLDLERERHGTLDLRPVGQGREIDQPDAIGELFDEIGGNLEGQPGLARTARARDGDQMVVMEPTLDLLDLALPPDEAGELDGQVVLEGVK